MRKSRSNTARYGPSDRHPVAAIALSSLLIGTTAAANPPPMRIAHEMNHAALPRPRTTAVRGHASEQLPWRTAPFDPPALQGERSYPVRFSAVPDLNSRSYLQDLSLPTLGGEGRGIRDQSPTEQFIRQARQEGLPLARLWQNDQALLSLGLNRKGKPGLWIIQKIR